MKLFRVLAAVAALFLSAPAFAQTVPLQAGPWTPGHAPMYSGGGGSQPVIQDSGPAGGGAIGLGLSEGLYVARGTGTAPYSGQGSGPSGTNLCDYDAPLTNATGYHFLCFSANATGGNGLITYGYGGGATPGTLSLSINGTTVPFGYSASLPLQVTAGNLSLNYDGNFVLSGNNLALVTANSGYVLANATAGTAEPLPVSPSAWFSRWCSASSDEVPYSTGASTWGCLGLLGTAHTWTGAQTFTTPIAVGSGGTGQSTFTANAPLIGSGTSPVTVGSRSGTTTVFATATGTLTDGDCVSLNAGNIIDAGGPCTTGGGGGTVSAGTANQMAWYAGTGTTVSGLATANSGVLITSAGGVPSISSTLPSAVQGNITSVGTVASGTWSGTAILPAKGGTGLTTITAHGVMIGEGTSNVATASLTNAQVLVGQTSADPAGETVSGDCTLANSGAITCTKSNGSAFGTAAFQNTTVFAQTANNLSDLASASSSRSNLGLGTAATLNVGTSANNVVQLNGSAQLPAVDGSLLTNLPSSGGTNYQAFTTAGSFTWTKPAGATSSSQTSIQCWGAGGGGGSNGGGGGGGAASRWLSTSLLGATETVTIPSGGAAGVIGGNATFGSWLTAYGGGSVSGTGGGGGGGLGGAGTSSSGTTPGNGGGVSGGNGGGGGNGNTSGLPPGAGSSAAWGGGGGGGGVTGGNANGGNGGASSTSGGGGGGGQSGGGSPGTGGSSQLAGAGGSVGVNGTAPAGGGGAGASGARGECRIATFL